MAQDNQQSSSQTTAVEERLVTVETQTEFDLVTSTWEQRVFVKLYVAARTSGLLREISDRDWKTLCVLATFMDEKGNCYPSQAEIADALGVTRQTANERIQSLKRFRFKDKPVIHIQKVRMDTEEGGRWANNVYTILPISNLKIFDANANGKPMSGNADTGGPMSGSPDTGNPDTNKKYVVINKDVVEMLTTNGIHFGVAEQLAMGYPQDYIEEKIDILKGLKKAPDNPAGWLRKAIEENYPPPPPKPTKKNGSKRQKAAKTASNAKSGPEIAEIDDDNDWKAPEPVKPTFDGDPKMQKAWETAYSELQLELPKETFDTWLSTSHILAYKEGMFTIGVSNIYAREWLEHRLKKTVLRTLQRVAKDTAVDICFTLFSRGE